VEQAPRFHQQAIRNNKSPLYRRQKIKNLQQNPDCPKQEKKALMQQRLTGKRRVKVDVDS